MTDQQVINGKLYNVEQRLNGLVTANGDWTMVGESNPATPASNNAVLFASTSGVPSIMRDNGAVHVFGKALTRVGTNTPTVSGTGFTAMLSITSVPTGEFRFRVHSTIKCVNTNGGSPCISMGHGTTATTTLCLAQSAWYASSGQSPGTQDNWTTHAANFPGDNVSSFVMVNNGIYTFICEGFFNVTGTGDIVVAGNNSIAGGSYTQQSGSYFEYEQVA